MSVTLARTVKHTKRATIGRSREPRTRAGPTTPGYPGAAMSGLPVSTGGFGVLRGFFDVARGRARITVRGRRDTRLVASRSATGRGALRAPTTDARSRRVLELLAHAIELRGMIRAEPTAGFGRIGAMTSAATTHRRRILTHQANACFVAPDHRPGQRGRCQGVPARIPACVGRLKAPVPRLSRANGWCTRRA
jgi:hypothetical protein